MVLGCRSIGLPIEPSRDAYEPAVGHQPGELLAMDARPANLFCGEGFLPLGQAEQALAVGCDGHV
jgi:hypothetical protein